MLQGSAIVAISTFVAEPTEHMVCRHRQQSSAVSPGSTISAWLDRSRLTNLAATLDERKVLQAGLYSELYSTFQQHACL